MVLMAKSIFIYIYILFCGCLIVLFPCISHAQAYTTIEIPAKDKPTKYEGKTLRAEKTEEGPAKGFKSFTQGLSTHFNYLFNANQRMERILNAAEAQYHDDYTQLLPFYNYSQRSVAQSNYWDTIINKSTGALLLHDLRNNWADEVYLILGKAYYYKGFFDTAAMHFQYLNYAFAPKDDGYDIPLASNSQGDGDFSVSSKEKKRIFAHRPRRNEGLLWLARTLTDQKDFGAAKGLLQMLAIDKNFPKNQQNNLHEILAYWNYQQHNYDSAAYYLTRSKDNVDGALNKSRRAFLTAQLYALSNDSANSYKYFEAAANKTPDLLMEIYSELNAAIWQPADGKGNDPEARLLRLAQKDKYHAYKDLLYYLIAQHQLAVGNQDAALASLQKSIALSENNQTQKSKSFYLLATIQKERFHFIPMANDYDSITVPVFATADENGKVDYTRQQMDNIARQLKGNIQNDSLIKISLLPKSEQNSLLKKELRKIRKRLGLKEQDGNVENIPLIANGSKTNAQTDLFGSDNDAGKWYFNNMELRNAGFQKFRQLFGNRPNVDNWQRQTAINNAPRISPRLPDGAAMAEVPASDNAIDSSYISMEDLRMHLPHSDTARDELRSANADNWFANGVIFQDKLGYYPEAIYSYHQYLSQTKNNLNTAEVLYRLYQCGGLTHNQALQDSAKMVLEKQHSQSMYRAQINKPIKMPAPQSSEASTATKTYSEIYDKLLAGDLDNAKKQKLKADSLYGTHYWTPQLLYIEAIDDMHHRDDSTAIKKLRQIQQRFGFSPISSKATTMIDVLNRRKDIEAYLTQLQITRKEDSSIDIVLPAAPVATVMRDTARAQINSKDTASGKLSTRQQMIIAKATDMSVMQPKADGRSFGFDGNKPQYLAIVLDKVAPTFVKEVLSSFSEYSLQLFSMNIKTGSYKLDDRYTLALLGPMDDGLKAYNYWTKVAPVASREIVPWLENNKYSYIIISEDNLDLLKENKNIDGYKAILQKAFPGKF